MNSRGLTANNVPTSTRELKIEGPLTPKVTLSSSDDLDLEDFLLDGRGLISSGIMGIPSCKSIDILTCSCLRPYRDEWLSSSSIYSSCTSDNNGSDVGGK